MRTSILTFASSVAVAVVCSSAIAQNLKAPEPSPAAGISQTIGLTEIKVSYHRPAVNGRKVWGELVPYNDVWRAGANENTTISFSTPVKLGGKNVPAGTYGLHMIPTAKDWTVILSNTAVAWGSYGYDPKEDALRVQVTPAASEGFEERLSYHFDNPTDSGALLTLRWEKLKVPLKIDVDTPAVTMASMRAELRGAAQFNWQPWAQAAQYWVTHGGNLDEAAKMADRSIGMKETFQNLNVRAAIADKKGDKKAADELRARAMAQANETDLNQYGYTLLFSKKIDDAIAIFQKNAKDHPDSWNVHDSLGEALATKGDKKAAVDSYAKALNLVKDDANKKRIQQTLTRLKGK